MFLVESESTFRFIPLMVVLALAFAVPILIARLKQVPVVVGEIIAGLIVGGSFLGWVQEDMILALMGDIGLAFLMFIAGMEIDFNMLFGNGKSRGKNGPNVLLLAFIGYLATLLLAGAGAMLLQRFGLDADLWLVIFILSATSLGVLLPVLKERGLMHSPFGQAIFISATLADFINVILLTVYLIIRARGLDPEIFSIGLLFVLFFFTARFGPGFTRLPQVRRLVEELSRATVQIKVRGAIAILLIFVVLAELVNAELILGAFLAGMIISLIKSPQDEALVHNLEAFGFGFFIPVFFILVGVNLDLSAITGSPSGLLALPMLLLASLVIKLLPMLVFWRLLGLRQTLAAGLLLNTHLSLEIAIAIVGVRAGLLSPAAGTAITLFAVLTVLLMPVLFGLLAPAADKTKPRLIALCGAGPEVIGIARELKKHGETVAILNADPNLLEAPRKAGYITSVTSAKRPFGDLQLSEVKSVAAICPDDYNNLDLGKKALAAGVQTVVAQVKEPARINEFRRLGIQPYVPGIAQSILLALLVRNPDFFTLLTSATDQRDVREVLIENASLNGLRLQDVSLPADVLVLSIRRGEEFIIPHGSVEIELFDRLTLLGSYDDLTETENLLL